MSRTIHIRARRGWLDFDWRELFESRDILTMLVMREWSALYKQTILGPLWFIIQPTLMTVVFTVIFGRIAQIPTDGTPPFLFYLSGILFWNYFSGVLNHAALSFASNAHILTKVYIPRLLIPAAGVIAQLAHFAVHLLLFVVFYAGFWILGATVHPTRWVVAIPFAVFQAAVAALGAGLLVCALTIKYRDLRFALPFFLQLAMYLSPVVYPLSAVPDGRLRVLLMMNPMTAVIEIGRLGLLGEGSPDLRCIALGCTVALALLVAGLISFNRMQRTFADIL
ncbi:MAG: ABC transporter permease [Kiritimatiellae bacterium]|nr:ABC transporter permease [Kiritimatiellia bacterium]MDW8458687.1 ABC transporter permease [Verrucomicrobiota bacterium]